MRQVEAPGSADWRLRPHRPRRAVGADIAVVRLQNQILHRFSKLQDAAGERLIAATLAHLAEACQDRPKRARLDCLERLGVGDPAPRAASCARLDGVCPGLAGAIETGQPMTVTVLLQPRHRGSAAQATTNLGTRASSVRV